MREMMPGVAWPRCFEHRWIGWSPYKDPRALSVVHTMEAMLQGALEEGDPVEIVRMLRAVREVFVQSVKQGCPHEEYLAMMEYALEEIGAMARAALARRGIVVDDGGGGDDRGGRDADWPVDDGRDAERPVVGRLRGTTRRPKRRARNTGRIKRWQKRDRRPWDGWRY
ncbi:hypothetical protein G5V57_09535 [Nordella sp. HKS 07]|uniref:hypothetical protein n=1 Tax=Nordella sp. HKS 07 TaxID=2712222 RepID=UPI0013E1F4C8|nr:hypothetical protein [Nordella sp. HKS 07]QIG47936.1 hypothetical protein G5V57_09535 [Nordella sp. HKS 07]